MLRKKKKSTANRTSSLGSNLSFLDVVQDACRKGGRYTLTAESNGASFTVLVDRGGPFNVSGGGLTGSAALATAAALRTGTFTVDDGWPVDQPLYQLGLDATIKGLLLGSPRTEMPDLPPARGVDSIRNAALNADPDTSPAGWGSGADDRHIFAGPPATTSAGASRRSAISATATPPPGPAITVPALDLPVMAPPAYAPIASPAAAASPAPPPIPTPALRPPANRAHAIAPVAVSPAPPAPVPAPPAAAIPAPPAAPVAISAAESIGIGVEPAPTREAGREMGFGETIELDAAMPGEVGASEKQGPLRHLLTQALLWTVQIEEPGRYTLHQSWILVLRALRSSFSFFLDPFEREVGQRWARTKEDWRKSGEAVAQQKPRKRSRPSPPK